MVLLMRRSDRTGIRHVTDGSIPTAHTAVLALVLASALSACTSYTSIIPKPPAATLDLPAAPTPTPDPCLPESLPASVLPLNEHMRQFDNLAALASNIVQSQVTLVLPPMQDILNEAQARSAPACLANLKRLELSYMDATLSTLSTFLTPDPDPAAITAGILQARTFHDQYELELARLLGMTPVSPTTPSASTPTP